jgi:glycosyltransferase involved in cell wall biosynthesis
VAEPVAPTGTVEAGGSRPVIDLRSLTLGFVAHNFEVKGGPAALEVHRRIREVLPDVRLLVAGPEDPDPGLDGVEWLGPKTRDELYAEVYPRIDVFVYPTQFDAAPLVLQEALAHGIPAVVPSILSLPELVRDGETGLLFAEGDVEQATEMTLRLLRDDALRRRMGEAAARDFAARFSAEVRNRTLGAAYRAAVH